MGEDDKNKKLSAVALNGRRVVKQSRIIRFRNRPMILDVTSDGDFEFWRPLHKERFEQLAYPVLGGVSRSRMNDVFAYVSNTAEDLTSYENLIGFGKAVVGDDGEVYGSTMVWDMEELNWVDTNLTSCVWRSPYGPAIPKRNEDGTRPPVKFVMELAGGDQDVYDDIMQSIAPIIMAKKPDGVIWWVGDGANGKSTLMDALYKIFPSQFSSITVKRLVDGRDTPSLNGTLANVVKESSEGRVEDTEIYKSIGTHENFRVHKFHSQDDIEVRGNVHHIFSANSVPTFNDKGYSARRRTFIIPFKQRFESDPTFEERTFTKEVFGQLIMEMVYYAAQIERQGFKYKWSAATLAAKADYDSEANNAEEYVRELIAQGVVAFNNYSPIKQDYENWCADNGYVPLGIGNLRRAIAACGFERVSKLTDNGSTGKIYRLESVGNVPLIPFSLMRPNLFTVQGFDKPKIPEFEEPRKAEPRKRNPIKEW